MSESSATPPNGTGTSTRPYLIRALYEWCTDNGFTPYIAVYVDASVQVPAEYVKNNEIVLNLSFTATSGLSLGNDAIGFRARFGGASREIHVPVSHVIAIYARENGQGMAFPVPSETGPAGVQAPTRPRLTTVDRADDSGAQAPDAPPSEPDGSPETPPPGGRRPALKRVK